MRRGVGAVFLAALALAAAAPAGASPGAQFGIQDDAWLMYGPGTLAERVTTLQSLGVGIVRFTFAGTRSPDEARPAARPGRRRYDWGAYGDVLDALHAARHPRARDALGLAALGERRRPAEPAADDPASATSRPPLPPASRGCACGPPGTSRTAAPSRRPVSPSLYVRRVLNPAYAALHAASGANSVAGGVTSPRKSPSGMSPLAFMQGMRAAHARLDAYAQNPYPVGRGETPSHATCRGTASRWRACRRSAPT